MFAGPVKPLKNAYLILSWRRTHLRLTAMVADDGHRVGFVLRRHIRLQCPWAAVSGQYGTHRRRFLWGKAPGSTVSKLLVASPDVAIDGLLAGWVTLWISVSAPFLSLDLFAFAIDWLRLGQLPTAGQYQQSQGAGSRSDSLNDDFTHYVCSSITCPCSAHVRRTACGRVFA